MRVPDRKVRNEPELNEGSGRRADRGEKVGHQATSILGMPARGRRRSWNRVQRRTDGRRAAVRRKYPTGARERQ